MRTPPAVYLLPSAHRIIIPPVVVYTFLHFVRNLYFGLFINKTYRIVISLLCLPLFIWLDSTYNDFKESREASRRGAVLPNQLKHSPGGLSLVFQLVQNLKSGYQSDVLLQWIEQYGTIVSFKTFFVRRILTTEPEYVKAILATEFDNFHKGPESFRTLHTLLGTGVFNSDEERWKFHRSATRPYFTKERIRHVDIFDRHAEDMLEQASTRLREGLPVDFQDMVARFTLDSATEFLFNNDVSSLSAGLPYPESHPLHDQQHEHPANIFVRSFAEAQDLTALRARRGPLWPFFEFWTDKVKQPRDVVNNFINPILDRAVEQRKATAALPQSEKEGSAEKVDDDVESKDESFLDHLVKLTDDKTILRDSILNVIVAGRDTTASTMTFAVYMMCEHPDLLQRLREEILSIIGPSRRPEFEDIKQMRYLRAFINETLRLYPAVPANGRTSKEATVWPSVAPGGPPIYIPANTRVIYSVFIMHRMKEYWGPDAYKFDPDRFLDERVKKYLIPKPFIFLPFNAGPRICVGQQFAYHEMSFLLIRLLQRFSGFSLATDAQPAWSKPPAEWAGSTESSKGTDRIWPGSHLTMYVKGGLWVRMTEVSANETV